MALITGVGLLAASIVTAVLRSLMAAEIRAWMSPIILSLIRIAVGRLPENRRERFQEEWQSHVNEVPGDLGKLLVAISFLPTAYRLAWYHKRDRVLEGLTDILAQLDDAQSRANTVANLIQADAILISDEEMTSNLNRLKSSLSGTQELRDQLATRFAILSARPNSVLALIYVMAHLSEGQMFDQILQNLKQMCGVATQVIEWMEDHEKRLRESPGENGRQ